MPFPPEALKKIREKMDLGVLPRDAPPRMFAGYGRGESCFGCDKPILPNQIEYEFAAADQSTIRFHLGCASLWEVERRRAANGAATAPASEVSKRRRRDGAKRADT